MLTITGTDPRFGPWQHVAFIPDPLPYSTPHLSAGTFNAAARARAALASLDSSAKRLPNPSLLRRSTLSREAQSTSALEGTYAPLQDVLAADEDEDQPDANLREVVNYLRAAEHALAWVADGRPLTLGMLIDLQARLVRGTPAETSSSGRVRDIQVVIGSHRGTRVQDARFVPRPPGPELEAQVRDWLDWVSRDTSQEIDPVVAAAMGHYQFVTLHPFNDGNGRIGRLFVVLQLLRARVITEPSLTVSPWFEARRGEYYERLYGVSARGDWDAWVDFFATALAASADDTAARLEDLLTVQAELKRKVRAAGMRADTAMSLVDFSLARPIFTVRQVEHRLGVGYVRANTLVRQLVQAGVLAKYDESNYNRSFTAPDVLAVLLR
ncbi:Fic family protein [Geodermatophilus sp. YIM 151500]|uniref:Fic family protein n=1 Tax=Geodermatophilus sp. YIM 151500 TaxID=2984531 RepID=UPI0021E3B094|nr:Fic/DOC family N-terminal domain-containing protein [Geodermatophilus sp. YIM 151500]MCV2490118.1 Fic family protein [Geodermatophilus sp. YIM 151500]